MKTATFIAALAGMAFAAPSPHAVTDSIAPAGEKTPDGCSTTYNGKFQVVVQTLNKRDVAKRDSQPLELSLKDGVLTDALGRTGYIASNNQFQFDGPAQAGAIYTAGWSVCANGSIALGNSAIFYQCLSGSFYNLYDEHTAAQCSPVFLNALGSGNAATGTVNNAAVVPTTGVQSVVCQIGDGQIQKDTCITTATAPPTTKPTVTGGIVTQIGDGQIQAPASSGTVAITTPATPATPKVQVPTGGATPSQNSTVPITTPSPTVATIASTTSARPVNTGAAASNAVGSELFGLVAAVAAVALLV